MYSGIVKRSLVLHGKKTSISLEDHFWDRLKAIAAKREMTITDIVSRIDDDRDPTFLNLSASVRHFVLKDALHLAKAAR